MENNGAIGIDSYSHPLISGNLIYRNVARDGGGGIQLYMANPFFLNNVICNNFAHIGGALFLNNSNAIFAANTICNNLSTNNECLFISQSRPEFYNSIIWGNRSQKIELDGIQIWSGNSLNFYYINIQGGQGKMYFSHEGAYEGNIDSDPVFANPTDGPEIEYDALQADWSITDFSPNINKGFPDIEQLMLPVKDIAGNLTIYPNPENNLFRLRVIDLTDKILRDINGISGSDYVLERDDLQKGYYIIELSGDKVYRGRILVE